MRFGREIVGVDGPVEVRKETLGMDGREWGPEGNIWRGLVALEIQEGRLGVDSHDGRGWGVEEAEGGVRQGRRKVAAEIKSNEI